MHRILLAMMGALLLHHPVYGQTLGLPVIDFERYFPHLVATSEEFRDPRSPNVLQWQFITVRDEQDRIVWLTLRQREGLVRIVQAFLAKAPFDGSEADFREVVAKFSEAEKIRFEIVDLRDIRTHSAFTERAASLGWGFQALPK